MNFIKDLLWSFPTVTIILAVGVYYTCKLSFFPVTGIKEIIKSTVGSLGKNKNNNGISPFMAVATAIGGTVGIGSIVGVGISIAIGGAGSIFWMWVSGFFGMMLKYAEVNIAVRHRVKSNDGWRGGAMYGLKAFGYPRLAACFCIFCVLASFGVGNLAQTNSVSMQLFEIGVPKLVTAFIGAALFGLVISGGQKTVARLSAFIVPLVSIVYLLCVTYILFLFLPSLPVVIKNIFFDAFGTDAVAGGFSGAMFSTAIRNGFARGVFSNEAGMGSSPIAHASAENADPHTQGMWGIVEIFIDTFVVSTATALVLLCAETDSMSELFSYCFGENGKILLAVLMSIFALASMISWYYYSEGAIKYLSSSQKSFVIYRAAMVAVAFIGALASVSSIWDLADIFNALMIFPNLFLLIVARGEISKDSIPKYIRRVKKPKKTGVFNKN